jgi:Holliday junction DNA helicase RuvB
LVYNRIVAERIIKSEQLPEDIEIPLGLRPQALDEYIGQREVVENLRIAIEAAKGRDEPVDHLLFYGPPGLGKTTLAHIVSNEMGAGFTGTSGPALERPADLVAILTNLGNGDIFFIDEIHRLNRVIEEYLYPAMEDFQVDIIIGKGPNARTLKLPLKPFTLIGATTRAGLLTSPLRDRFGIIQHLDFYPPEDLARIILRSSEVLKIVVDEAGADVISHRSRGTPRVANRLLKRVRDFAQVRAAGKINNTVADDALKKLGIDDMGLDQLDKRFLHSITDKYEGGPVGLETLAATLCEEVDTLTDIIEPYLMKIGFLKRTPRGRMATRHAYDHLGVSHPAPNTGQERFF